jgi:hypothetical protein
MLLPVDEEEDDDLDEEERSSPATCSARLDRRRTAILRSPDGRGSSGFAETCSDFRSRVQGA